MFSEQKKKQVFSNPFADSGSIPEYPKYTKEIIREPFPFLQAGAFAGVVNEPQTDHS